MCSCLSTLQWDTVQVTGEECGFGSSTIFPHGLETLGRRERSWAGCRGGIETQSSRWGALASFTELGSDLSHIGVICPNEEWTWGSLKLLEK